MVFGSLCNCPVNPISTVIANEVLSRIKIVW